MSSFPLPPPPCLRRSISMCGGRAGCLASAMRRGAHSAVVSRSHTAGRGWCAAHLERRAFPTMKRRARELRNRPKEPSAGLGRLRDSLGSHERSIKEAFALDPF